LTRPVTVQFLKNPEVIHWGFEAQWLGEDEWGAWIALPMGSKRWKGHDEVEPSTGDAVFCAPRDGWWHLHYNGATHPTYSHFVDIATPPVWVSEDRYEMIDLDLDVAVYRDGRVEVQDEDEFETHQVQYQYSAEMIRRAREETRMIVSALQNRQEPFFEVAAVWLSQVPHGG
jgi:uncharacterized protein